MDAACQSIVWRIAASGSLTVSGRNGVGFDFAHLTPEGQEILEYRFVPSPTDPT
ncbi:hypothetical protein AAW51_2519 [Caldimonas brevitalea]|uniref:Uncharacterized protein n=1 Tax=Caldimonas brevitalea TaxID=413882 RepID=A0A0G3BRP5_9BURK|nr:hypothetical protein AAW51_2519 [Caldimonas brevitalea]